MDIADRLEKVAVKRPGPQVSLARAARRGVDADTQGGNSLENCSTLFFYTEGKKKPDLVCTKPGFSILKSGGCHGCC